MVIAEENSASFSVACNNETTITSFDCQQLSTLKEDESKEAPETLAGCDTNSLITSSFSSVSAAPGASSSSSSSSCMEAGASEEVAVLSSCVATCDDLTYQPSEYELQRLERIRRNQEYLASLGLATLQQQKPQQNKKRKKSAEMERPPIEQRPKSSRLQGREFNFNVDDLLNIRKMTTHPHLEDIKTAPDVIHESPTNDAVAALEQQQEPPAIHTILAADSATIDYPPAEKKIKYREFITKELRRMQTERRINLRNNERYMKAADKELRLALREYEWVSKRKNREEETKKRRLHWEEFRLGTVISTELTRMHEEANTLKKVVDSEVLEHRRATSTELKCVLDTLPNALQSASALLEQFASSSQYRNEDHQSQQQLQTSTSSCCTIKVAPNLENATTSPEKKSISTTSTNHDYPSDFFLKGETIPPNAHELTVAEAARIDRSWLEMDNPVKSMSMCYQTFVPQVDDLVVYYPTGHKAFLSQFPNIQKNIDRQRKSFRHSSSAVEQHDENEEYSFLKLMEKYGFEDLSAGVVCIVKDTHAEFPAQDYSKIHKSATPFVIMNRHKNIPMALSVTLRPIADSSGHFGCPNLPPSFTFQLYPTLSLYCLPIHAALYSSDISIADQVKHQQRKNKGYVQSVCSGLHLESSTTLHCSRFKDRPCLAENISVTGNRNTTVEESGQAALLDTLVLPRWGGICVEWEDGSSRNVSAWELIVAQSADLSKRSLMKSNAKHRTGINVCSQCTMNEELRFALEETLTKFIRTHDGVEPFLEEVTDTLAPGYLRVVPFPMCFRRVMKRLKVSADDDNSFCYYHSVLSLASDLRLIYRNCLLYNHDRSGIAKLCHKVVTDALNSVKSVHREIMEHHRFANESLRSIEHKKRILIDKRWCGGHLPDASCKTNGGRSTLASNQIMWIPQVGDDIIYDKVLHETFISHHKLTLTAKIFCSGGDQCNVSIHVMRGKVIKVYPVVFPEDDLRIASFPKSSSVLHVTMEFASGESEYQCLSALWRPCNLGKSCEMSCVCGGSSSFLSPAWLQPENVQPRGIDKETLDHITYCLQTLRYRCSIGLSSDKISGQIISKLQYLNEENHVDWEGNEEGIFLPDQSTGPPQDARLMMHYFNGTAKVIGRSPNPYLSIELVLLRLRHQFYRHLSAVESDIKVAFSLMSVQLLDKSTQTSIALSLNAKTATSPRPATKQNKTPEQLYDILLQMYSTAVLCISKPKLCSMAFGFICKKALFERLLPFKERAYRLDRLIAALENDPCENHRVIDILEPYPTVSIRVRCLDDGSKGKFISSSSSGTLDSGIGTTLIPMDPYIYQGEEKLAIALFGKPERHLPCVRCSILGRKFLQCRVRSGHSNPSLCLEELKEENGLRSVIDTVRVGDGRESQGSGTAEVIDDSQDHIVSNTGVEVDLAITVDKAKLAHRLAHEALTESKSVYDSPLELTEDFVKANFPVDLSDGHFLLCTVCGYGGDMLVCEGCPVVAHADCCNLMCVPQGDWYCNKCSTKRSQITDIDTADFDSNAENIENSDQPVCPAISLEALLHELKSYRLSKMFSVHMKRGNDGRWNSNENDSMPHKNGEELHETPPTLDEDANTHEQPLRRIHRKHETRTEDPSKKRRGRPRKISSAHAAMELEATPTSKEGSELAEQPQQPEKRPRGRPRKSSSVHISIKLEATPTSNEGSELADQPEKRPRGRPRKNKDAHAGNDPETTESLDISEQPVERRRRTSGSAHASNEPGTTEVSDIAEQPVERRRGRPRKVDSASPRSIEDSILENMCAGQIIRKSHMVIYIAENNDQISAIATMFDVSVQKVVDLNKKYYPSLKSYSKLKALTRITLPGSARIRSIRSTRNSKAVRTGNIASEKAFKKENEEKANAARSSSNANTGQTDYSPNENNTDDSSVELDSSVSSYEDSHEEVLVELPSHAQANQPILVHVPSAENETVKVFQITHPSFTSYPDGQSRRFFRVKLPILDCTGNS